MYKQNGETISEEALWQDFVQNEQLTPEQEGQFKQYTDLLLEWNQKTNITRITDLADVLQYHYRDALHLDRFIDMHTLHTICDIGTGGGVPGIPLKIKYPQLRVILIEVNTKKIAFLNHVIETLGLKDIVVVDLDWRTFLRTSREPIDLFVSRASLPVTELTRALTSGTAYHKSTMVYWASMHWQTTNQEKPYITRDESYELGDKKRRYIFLKSE